MFGGNDAIGFGALTQAIAWRSMGKDYHYKNQKLQEKTLDEQNQTRRMAISAAIIIAVIIALALILRRRSK